MNIKSIWSNLDEGKKQDARDAVKAFGITACVAVVIAAAVLLSRQFGIG
jgi:hypothetical protein